MFSWLRRKMFGRGGRRAVATGAPRPQTVLPSHSVKDHRRLDTVRVVLAEDRDLPGALWAHDQHGWAMAGPWPVAGRANDRLAALQGNLSRDPQRPFGDTPLGVFEAMRSWPVDKGDKDAVFQFGPHGGILLRPLSGEAASAKRGLLMLHGGARPWTGTDGSLRTTDEAMAFLVRAMPTAGDGRDPPQVVVEHGESREPFAEAASAVNAAAVRIRPVAPIRAGFFDTACRDDEADLVSMLFWYGAVYDRWGWDASPALGGDGE